ncbi:MAG: Sec-independent protein translocase subunit TatA [Micrococcales bacterium]|nr:Sec-independent protein translocase subunit TatA [Micrococcales bacterium]
MPNLGAPEIIIIALVIILLFGFKKLPDAARSIGRSMRVFKSEMDEMKTENGAKAPRETVEGEVRRETRADSPVRDAELDGRSAVREDAPRTDNQSGPVA